MKNRYFIRVIKFMVYIVLFIIILRGLSVLLSRSGNSCDTFLDVFKTPSGMVFLVVLFGLALIHPLIGYRKKELIINANDYPEEIKKVMDLCNYKLVATRDGVESYRAVSMAKKLNLMFEDEVTITTKNDQSVLAGPRREVVKMSFRIDSFIREQKEGEHNDN